VGGLHVTPGQAVPPVRRQLPSVRGDLLVKRGRPDEAQVEFGRAAALTGTGASENSYSIEHGQRGNRPLAAQFTDIVSGLPGAVGVVAGDGVDFRREVSDAEPVGGGGESEPASS
jgi:hypothetical protein